MASKRAFVATAAVALILGAAAAGAAPVCAGRDLMDDLTDAQRAEIEAAVDGTPFARGLLWEARRGAARMTLAGTYHLPDARHEAILNALDPALAEAAQLLVEAGPDEQAALAATLAADVGLLVADGPPLPDRLAEADWQTVADAMAARGVPAVVAARMEPWYVAVSLAISPCLMAAMADPATPRGLDEQLIARAARQGVPVGALEPWDTMITLFAGLTPEEEVEMIRAALPAATLGDDYGATLAERYFAGDVWTIWEFGRLDAIARTGLPAATVERQLALVEDRVMTARNMAWLPVLTDAADAAAPTGKAVVAAFGALHLPGEGGVLRLLERDGWTVTALPMP